MVSQKIQIFFTKLFSNKILENEVVATVLYVVSLKLNEFKTKMDNTLNTQI
jgi:hypothetical protein